MSQEETEKNISPNADASDSTLENLNPAEVINDSTSPGDSENIDNLPIESIGSYARLEELLTDEDSEKTGNPPAQS